MAKGVWQVKTDVKWTDYKEKTSSELSAASLRGENIVKIKVNRSTYIVNLRDMTQTNAATETVRPIRELASAGATTSKDRQELHAANASAIMAQHREWVLPRPPCHSQRCQCGQRLRSTVEFAGHYRPRLPLTADEIEKGAGKIQSTADMLPTADDISKIWRFGGTEWSGMVRSTHQRMSDDQRAAEAKATHEMLLRAVENKFQEPDQHRCSPPLRLVRTDPEELANWKFNVVRGEYGRAGSRFTELLNCTCTTCGNKTPNVRYHVSCLDEELYRQQLSVVAAMEAASKTVSKTDRRRPLVQAVSVCSSCWEQQQPPNLAWDSESDRNDTSIVDYIACTNGATLSQEVDEWLAKPFSYQNELNKKDGKAATAKGSKVQTAIDSLFSDKDSSSATTKSQRMKSQRMKEKWLRSSSCGLCCRPFPPGSHEGAVDRHWSCPSESCALRYCENCVGAPTDAHLLFAQQRLALAKFTHIRLCEGSPTVDLDVDVIQAKLSILLTGGNVDLHPMKGHAMVLAGVKPCDESGVTLPPPEDKRPSWQRRGNIREHCLEVGDLVTIEWVPHLQPERGSEPEPENEQDPEPDNEDEDEDADRSGANPQIVKSLRDMGYLPNVCRRAALETGNADLAAAVEWCLGPNGTDPKSNDPLPDAQGPLAQVQPAGVETELRRVILDPRIPRVVSGRPSWNEVTVRRDMTEFLVNHAEATKGSSQPALLPLSPVAYELLVDQQRNMVRRDLQTIGHERRKEAAEEQMSPSICWGGATWIFVADGRRYVRVRDIVEGDEVRTATGQYRRVTRIWETDYSDPKRNTEVVFLRGVWMTSHHPVLVGSCWRYPTDLAASFPSPGIAAGIGNMLNFELEGHLDTLLICGGENAPIWPPIVSCTLGKYLGKSFGYGMWTRRSTRCARPCAQCDCVYMPLFDPTSVPTTMRWATFPAFEEVEYLNGHQPSFWPADAEAAWQKAGLKSRDSSMPQQQHRTAEQAVAEATAAAATSIVRPNVNPQWRRDMLKNMDHRITSMQQHLTDKALERLLVYHEEVAQSSSTQQVASSAEAVLESEEKMAIGCSSTRAIGCVWQPSVEYRSLLASDSLSESHRQAYTRMQQRRRERCGSATRTQAHGLDSDSDELAKSVDLGWGESSCGLCLQVFDKETDRILPCELDGCDGAYCASCWERHVAITIGSVGGCASRYACSVVQCPRCQRRVPTASWAACLPTLGEEYSQRAHQLLSMRCAECGEAGCLLRASSVRYGAAADDDAAAADDDDGDDSKKAALDVQQAVGKLLRSLRRQAWITGKELGCDCSSTYSKE